MEQINNDALWLKQIAAGDKDAFAQLLCAHLSSLLAFVKRFVPEQAEAEDITQEVFTRVWEHASRWQQREQSPRSWFFKIAYHLCIDFLRKQKNTTDIVDTLISPDSPEHALHRSQDLTQMNNAMDTLPERQRTALYLCAYQGLSNKEAASIMDISTDALESLLARGRRSLRNYFENLQGAHYETA